MSEADIVNLTAKIAAELTVVLLQHATVVNDMMHNEKSRHQYVGFAIDVAGEIVGGVLLNIQVAKEKAQQ